ncbi:distal tail protein Dit [Thermaerobacter composti]|uniref:Phage tail family protein n=1 Tax=Thermaerobacter composti TaxID=554949 RepID=A0ABZ0QRR1_9FIRM|nr:distal tail protein Dit [Thermaerobacter composti]WPD20174.1 phage tail family protein [Thermaerobacter composti]
MAVVTGISPANAPGFTFDGVHSSTFDVYLLRSPFPLLPETADRHQEVPGRHGVWDYGFRFEGRKIELECFVIASSEADLRAKVRAIAAWLDPSKGERELVLDTESDKTYMARVSGSIDVDMVARHGRFTIPFFASDPFAYGPERTLAINGETIVTAQGTAEAWPVITVNVQAPITYLLVATPDKYVLLGRPEGVEETPVPKEQKVLVDGLDTTTGWIGATQVDGGAVTGSLVSTGTHFEPSSYGSGSGWHGPALKKSVAGGPIQDFRVTVFVQLSNSKQSVGRAELYLLDVNNAIFGKIALKDTHSGVKDMWGEARAGALSGGYYFVQPTHGAKAGVWNDFDGLIRIGRIGNRWHAYFAMVDKTTGKHHTRLYREWVDSMNQYMNPLAQVQLHAGAYSTHQPMTVRFWTVVVEKINPLGTAEVPYIADAGDIIEIDCERHAVYLNGEPRLDLLDPGSEFFSLQPGQPVAIGVAPEGAVSVQLSYRERWL